MCQAARQTRPRLDDARPAASRYSRRGLVETRQSVPRGASAFLRRGPQATPAIGQVLHERKGLQPASAAAPEEPRIPQDGHPRPCGSHAVNGGAKVRRGADGTCRSTGCPPRRPGGTGSAVPLDRPVRVRNPLQAQPYRINPVESNGSGRGIALPSPPPTGNCSANISRFSLDKCRFSTILPLCCVQGCSCRNGGDGRAGFGDSCGSVPRWETERYHALMHGRVCLQICWCWADSCRSAMRNQQERRLPRGTDPRP